MSIKNPAEKLPGCLSHVYSDEPWLWLHQKATKNNFKKINDKKLSG